MNYNKSLSQFLANNGYSSRRDEWDRNYYHIKGKGIKGAIWDKWFFADNYRCYDKHWKCPFIIVVKNHYHSFNLIPLWLEQLATESSYEHSRKFAYYDRPVFPREYPF